MHDNAKSGLALNPSKKCSQSINGSSLLFRTELTESFMESKFSSSEIPRATST